MGAINFLFSWFERHVFADKDLMDLVHVLGFKVMPGEVLFMWEWGFFLGGFGKFLGLGFLDLVDGTSTEENIITLVFALDAGVVDFGLAWGL